MELGLSLAPELVTSADPLSRGLPESVHPPGRAPDADSGAAPFELLLQMLGNRLPNGLPGGETLPAGGNVLRTADAAVPDAGAAPAPLDPTAQGAAVALLVAPPVPLPPVLAPPPAVAGAANFGMGPSEPLPTALAQALRVALAAAPIAATLSPAADTATTSTPAVAAGTDAPAAAPLPTPGASSAGPAETPADLAALFALDPAAPAAASPAAEPLAARPRTAGDIRARALAATPAAGVFSAAADAVRADATAVSRSDALRGFDLQAAPPSTAPLATAQLDDALPSNPSAPVASLDLTAAGTSTGFASQLSQPSAPSAPAQSSAPLPPNLGTPVDTHAARWHDALASRIHWLVDHAVGEAQIKLNPPELGALDVKISMLDDKTFVQMTAHTSAARDEIAASLPRLRELMSAGGLDLGGATVSGGRDDRSGYAAAHPMIRTHAFATDSSELGADPLPRVRLASTSRIDLFA